MLEWWRWVLAGTAALLVVAIFAIRFDKLKNDPGATNGVRWASSCPGPWSSRRRSCWRCSPRGGSALITVAVPAVGLLVADSFD